MVNSKQGKDSLSKNLKQSLLEKTLFPSPGAQFSIAVSGGADSTALLVLATYAGLDVTVYHVNHQIRKESDAEEIVVENLAKRYGAKFVVKRVKVAPGANLEARLRKARFSVLPENIATAHTMDDQVETILINLIRGCGLKGLSGMELSYKHPMLEIRRSEALKVCEIEGIEPIRDPTNFDMRFSRNRVRYELIPLLNSIAKRDVVPIIARMAKILRQDWDLVESIIESQIQFYEKNLDSAPLPIMRRIVKKQVSDDRYYWPSNGDIERIVEMIKVHKPAVMISNNRKVSFVNNQLIIKQYNQREY